MTVFSRFMVFTNKYPIVRGMMSYSLIWPTSCIIQQTISGKNYKDYDWWQALRFSLYGGLFVAPTLYSWIRISTLIWPTTSLKTSITKSVIEQFTYGPAALACFFFGMSILEGQSVEKAIQAVKLKFWPTYKVAVCVWPVLQTINFLYIKEKNRVTYVATCSLFWCCFLAYMHQLRIRREKEINQSRLE